MHLNLLLFALFLDTYTVSGGESMIPASFAMATAVSILSPVTILTVTPPCWHFYTAALIPSLKGSLIPKIETRVSP
jgi:hypothetical protein